MVKGASGRAMAAVNSVSPLQSGSVLTTGPYWMLKGASPFRFALPAPVTVIGGIVVCPGATTICEGETVATVGSVLEIGMVMLPAVVLMTLSEYVTVPPGSAT